jgi:hypothetical protein
MLENTYTYTARSADHPERVVTFTLYDHGMSVEVGAPLEHIARALQPETGEIKAEVEAEHEALSHAWLKPMAVSLRQQGTRPFNVADIDAKAEDEGLRVTAWVRTGGLRFAPITFFWERVDNPKGAGTFVEELRKRKGKELIATYLVS